jgi:hypothetical protein
MLTVQYGYAALLDSLLQFCPAESAVLETSASNHTNASSSKIQSTASGPAANLVTFPALFGGGRLQRPVFRGALLRLPPQGPAAVQGRQQQRQQGARLRWRWHRQRAP